ncbi:hypothetical protein AGMMS49525_14700 [Bacteroidia bacterium]|nr:hypothetical protein AGMMS49525_14700 [Bacteroidia bacterium]
MKKDSYTKDFIDKIHEMKAQDYAATKQMTIEQKKAYYQKEAADFDAELERLKLKNGK